ncbi:unnamed protein product [Didymodactylos carnosus]|uniref:Endonuclease/exonuclease/phosphatase domain-containing protein n=1 Tax=Didymodactylos carnosus TaxID=1234261 RepID=A0A814GJ79_9BILA|nr:unnamed protein product [Didymodactylos carnosus]CAF3768617.1 unnamed protein product [Didymodactylos carnosus]
MNDSGISTIDDFTIIHSGASGDNKTRSAHGVAVCLNKQAAKVWTDSGSEWEAISDRIIMVRLGCKPINITVLAVYAPVNPSDEQKAQSAASIEFYKCLQETMDKVSRRDIVLLMGDFNARVGLQQSQTAGDVIGKHTIDQQNENGQLLVDFCSLNNLIVTNTFFQHKPVHQASWMHPGNKRWHLLDYILVNWKFCTSVHGVRAHRRAAGFIGADHHLLRAKLKIHLKSRTKNQQQKRLKLDYQKLRNDTLRDGFKRDIERKKNEVYDDEMTIDEKYSQFVEHVRELGTRYFQQENNAKK